MEGNQHSTFNTLSHRPTSLYNNYIGIPFYTPTTVQRPKEAGNNSYFSFLLTWWGKESSKIRTLSVMTTPTPPTFPLPWYQGRGYRWTMKKGKRTLLQNGKRTLAQTQHRPSSPLPLHRQKEWPFLCREEITNRDLRRRILISQSIPRINE